MTEGLPPNVPFHALTVKAHEGGYMAVGIDGEFLRLDPELGPIGDVHQPFPMGVRHTCMSDGVFVATWIDHELLMARMAAIDCSQPLQDGPDRGTLRTRTTIESAHHPKGSIWSHVLDAEPLALCGHSQGFAFVLYKKGIYAMGNDAGEHWRVELPTWPELKKLPRANDVIAATKTKGLLKVWSRGGGSQSYDLKNGDLVASHVFRYDGVLQQVYASNGHELLVYDNGSIVWRHEDSIVAEGKLAGPVQHAYWSEEEQAWRIAGWREELFISASGFERSEMQEIPVHIMNKNGTILILLNNGTWIRSSL
ncbi:MAG: hypothetical protein ACJZ40_05175 [Candidatus Poseidoniaceae archaeon]